MKKGYAITCHGCKQDGYIPVVTGPGIGKPLLFLKDKSGESIRYESACQAEAHAGHYLCKILNERIADNAPDKTIREILDVLDRALREADDMAARGFPLPEWEGDARSLFAKLASEN